MQNRIHYSPPPLVLLGGPAPAQTFASQMFMCSSREYPIKYPINILKHSPIFPRVFSNVCKSYGKYLVQLDPKM